MPNKKTLSFSLPVSPVQFAELMFENTDSDGVLNFKDWYDVEKDDLKSYNHFCCSLKWAEKDVDHIINEYKSLYKELQIIAKQLDQLDEIHLAETRPFYNSTCGLLDSTSLEATYFIFVAPFKAETEKQRQCDIIGRVGEGLCGYDMIRHARRLCKLLSLNAPESILNNEGRMLVAAMALYNYGEFREKV